MAILLIDDEPMLRQSLVDYLEDLDSEAMKYRSRRGSWPLWTYSTP